MQANRQILEFFAHYIESQIGIVYLDVNYFQLEHRLNEIVTQLGFQDLNQLYQTAQAGVEGHLKELLLDLATNNETSFFREQSAFVALAEYVIPELLKLNPGLRYLKIWSAAGSTGQEAYSIAMCLEGMKQNVPQLLGYEILMTDFSERVLAQAQEGIYTQLEIQRGVSQKNLSEFFIPEKDSWRMKPEIKNKVKFMRHNLLESFANLEGFHLVFCRNVLIYQSVKNKIEIISKLANCLTPRGYLFLGASESMIGLSQEFDQRVYQNAFMYQRKT
jgi:chemotaxis protein methyltransferase CheR